MVLISFLGYERGLIFGRGRLLEGGHLIESLQYFAYINKYHAVTGMEKTRVHIEL